MASVSGLDRTPLVVGVNHQTGGLTLRDRLFVQDEDVGAFLAGLQKRGVEQAIVVSTCDRVEVATVADDPAPICEVLSDALAGHGEFAPDELLPALYRHAGEAAVRHVFRVASSLDSVVVGEPQVLGQLKACHRQARDAGMVSGDLETLMQAAYSVAKRVRTETAIGERPVSIATVAVGIARDVFGDLKAAKGVLLGLGDMGELITREMQRAGLGAFSVVDTGQRTAAGLAADLGARHIAETDLADALTGADVVISAVGGRRKPLTADMVRAAIKNRRYRPQFIVDAALPSDVEPAVDRIEDAFLYDIGDLERLAVEGRVSREAEADAAERIVEDEVKSYISGRRERAATPALLALREHVQKLREQVLAEAGGDAGKATHLLVQRLLHAPTEKLRTRARFGEDIEAMDRLIRELFDIAENNADDGDKTS